jgi:hypothetical protein
MPATKSLSVGHVGEHVVAEQQVGLAVPAFDRAAAPAAPKNSVSVGMPFSRAPRHVGGRLDAEHGMPMRRSAGAGSRRCWRSRPPAVGAEAEAFPHHQPRIAPRVLHPAVRERGEVGVLGEDLAGRDELLQLHEEAVLADVRAQRVERLHGLSCSAVMCVWHSGDMPRSTKVAQPGGRRSGRATQSDSPESVESGQVFQILITDSIVNIAAEKRSGSSFGGGVRVFVTGVTATSARCSGPTCMARGLEVVGLDTGYYRDGWLYSDNRRFARRRAQQGPARDQRGTWPAATRWRTSPSCPTIRSARTGRRSPIRSTTRGSVHLARSRARPASALRLHLVLQRLRRRHRRVPRRDHAGQSRRPPTRSARCWSNATSARWPARTSARCSCATRPATGRRRGCASTSSSTTCRRWPGPPGASP